MWRLRKEGYSKMDIERINSILNNAILAFQENEIEEIIEATAHGVTSYRVPSPKKAVRIKKITIAKVKRALKSDEFRLYHGDWSWFIRSADVSPGINIIEFKWNGKPVRYKYKARAYQGESAVNRWDSIDDASLKKVVVWINKRAQEAADHVAAETGETF